MTDSTPTTPTPTPPPAILKQAIEQGIAFVARSGLVVESLAPGEVCLRMPLKGNQNHIGTLYAGALFTAAEIPGGALFLAGFDPAAFYPVVKELNLRFLKPATTDILAFCAWPDAERARVRAEAESAGKSEFTLAVRLADTHGVTVAEATGVYQIRRHR